jgi:hypothetical protein
MTAPTELPIATLIDERSRTLGLSRLDVVTRAGFKNVAKGIRRLDSLRAGDLSSTKLIGGLPTALALPPEIVDEAVRQTRQQIDEAARIAQQEHEAKWRAEFKPSAYLLGTETTPTQITIYGMTGGSERWLKIPLDLSEPPVTFARQALVVVKRTPMVPFFGKTVGYVVNYTPGFAARFDLNGDPVEAFDAAYSPGRVSIAIGGRTISADVLAKILASNLSHDQATA